VVDLDAARSGVPTNTAAIRAIRQAVDVNMQMGGGVRDEQTLVAMLALGIRRVVIGSAALEDWHWFERLIHKDSVRGRVALGLDARRGKLAVHGWTEVVERTPLELARRVRGSGLGAIVYTDISRDGMLEGMNTDAIAELIAATDVPVVASGGVGSLDDVRACRRIGCAGVIVGKAYYEGRVDIAEACRLAADEE
jgi:phosphoribosylformimino-5-aminoimidazole carboxamide ribotide isomerase